MSLYRSLPVSKRHEVYKLYKEAYPDMQYRDMVKHFNDGGTIDGPDKPKGSSISFQYASLGGNQGIGSYYDDNGNYTKLTMQDLIDMNPDKFHGKFKDSIDFLNQMEPYNTPKRETKLLQEFKGALTKGNPYMLNDEQPVGQKQFAQGGTIGEPESWYQKYINQAANAGQTLDPLGREYTLSDIQKVGNQRTEQRNNYWSDVVGGASTKTVNAVATLGMGAIGDLNKNLGLQKEGSFVDNYIFPSTKQATIDYNNNASLSDRTTYAGEGLLAGIGSEMGAGVIDKGAGIIGKQIGNAYRELLYNGIDPVGYGVGSKITNFIPNLIKNTTTNSTVRAYNVGERIAGSSVSKLNNVNNVLTRLGESRLDSFRVGLGLNQKFKTFDKVGENTYSHLHMNRTPAEFSELHGDIKANDITNRSLTVRDEIEGLQDVYADYARKFGPQISENGKKISVYDFNKELGFGVPSWSQTRIVDKPKILPDGSIERKIYDADRSGVMGQHHWVVKNTDDGMLHFTAKDRWDLHPFDKRGRIEVNENESLTRIKNRGYKKSLKDVELLNLFGGKPFNIENNFIVNPNTYEVIRKYKLGGEI